MTLKELTGLGLPLDMTNGQTALAVESGLQWVAQNTTFVYAEGEELPANVKLFLVKYADIILRDSTVTSESLGGMSQSFSSEGAGIHLRQLASELLGEWYKAVRFIPAKGKWGNAAWDGKVDLAPSGGQHFLAKRG